MHRGMVGEESPDTSGFVGREVVPYDAYRATRRLGGDHLAEKGDKLLTGMARRGLADHPPRGDVQRGIQRQCAVAVVFEAVPFGAPGRQRQHGIEPIESLNRGLLVEAEDRWMLRRIDVQCDNVGGFRLKRGIGRSHVAVQPVRLEVRTGPYAGHHHVRDAECAGQLAGAPVCGPVARRPARALQDLGFELRGPLGNGLAAVSRIQPAQPLCDKPGFPARDERRVAAQRRLDGRIGLPLGEHQDQPRAPHIIRAHLSRPDALAQLSPFVAAPTAPASSAWRMIHKSTTKVTGTGH